ncbi:MAG: phenylalanine--tRNA ligase subunit beta [Maricaulaceae bacterium]|nr:phenylalanine--tRNA ligase subunit beta [Maricaulaceae bacterium]
MKFTLSWLKEHLKTSATLAEIADAMTMAGLEIEHVENPADSLAAFTVAKVIEARPHPDADKLRVCTVDTRDGIKEIVCGAPNARSGMLAVYAPLGAYMPGADFTLDAKPRKIRGVESHGMLCSAAELGLGDDHDGIIDLAGEWPVGTPAAQALGAGDAVIDFEVTPNRPDWLGVAGVARDLAAAGAGEYVTPKVEPVKGNFPCPVAISTDWAEACPVFAGRVIRGVRNGPSPDWLQKRLKAIGLRPINALVDVTNLISHDRGRPLHVYDAAKITGAIRARRGDGAADRFEALDGREYAPDESMCVIADDARALGLGGVMGGEYSGCTDATTGVFIESAWFDPVITRATGKATGIESDARRRFERGVDPGFVLPGLELATRLILDLCGGEPSEVRVAGAIPAPPADIAFPVSEVKRLTGLNLPRAEIVNILTALGFGVSGAGDVVTVSVPSWRRDCEQKADLVEEVARIHGYDRIRAVSLPRPKGRRTPTATPGQNRARAIRRMLALRGYHEAVTWSFCETAEAALFGYTQGLALANPISSELDVMRPTPFPHLLKALQENADRGAADPRLFELGPAYMTDAPDGQISVAAGVRRVLAPRHWAGARAADLFDAKADALAALAAAGAPVDSLSVAAEARGWWHPGRSGVIRLGPKTVLAEFGELHPAVLKKLGVEGRVIGFEVYPDAIPQPKRKAETKARPALVRSAFMPVRRDFAFVVDEAVTAQDVIRAAKGAERALIADVALFDVYRGKGVVEGRKSLALEAVIQPFDKTLTDAEIDAVAKKIVAAVEKATGGTLRG